MTSSEIRQQFIQFFVDHGHTFVPSSPVVPHDDPTLLFTNAGMNQFKPYFLGQAKAPWPRAANTQKCIRAGGKHNDLDDVGRSRRHHTFFEMLGNWSFGDYFKRGAIEMAWELLTKVWKLDPNRLHVSCYEGNEAAGIPRDTEAANIWKEVAGVADDHIHYFGKDNFWEMGDTGPCGPCTEIYYDRRPESEMAVGRSPVNGEDPRVMEIWNNVFIQYESYYEEEGAAVLKQWDTATEPERGKLPYVSREDVVNKHRKLRVLPSQHVDTGMGLERICQVLQGKDDNYATDLFTPIFDGLTKLTGISYRGLFPPTNAADPVAEAANPQLRHDIAFRVIADHLRCLTFALTDGGIPDREGPGYVLRRILRRAVFWGRKHLGIDDPFIYRLLPIVVESTGGAFPELRRNPQHAIDLIKDEEQGFRRTWDRGIQLFEDAAKVGQISGRAAFELQTTYGFPIDLTRIMAEERSLTVDISGYETLMAGHVIISRGQKDGASKVGELSPAALAELAKVGVKPTDDQPKYSHESITAKIVAVWNGEELSPLPTYSGGEGEGEGGSSGNSTASSAERPAHPSPLPRSTEGEGTGSLAIGARGEYAAVYGVQEDQELAIILDRTNFYAEMGGQVGDAGELQVRAAGGTMHNTESDGGAVFDVESTKVIGGYVLHIGRIRAGKLKAGDVVTAKVVGGRDRTEKNHTTTHLANWALREVLGDDVQQKGSLVDPEKLRFDFSHGKALSEEELARVETFVNEGIAKSLPVYAETAPQEQALKIHGLRAVFGEKYPPMVRVVSVGVPVKELLADPGNAKWRQYSIEFCGGTHLANSGTAETFAVTAEESVSKGIRRIVALTGDAAKAAGEAGKEIDALIAQARAADEGLPAIIASLQKAVGGTVPLRAKRRAQAAVTELQSRYKAFQKAASKAAGAAKIDVGALAAELFAAAGDLGGGKLIVGEVPGASDEQLRSAVDSLKTKAASYAVMVGAAADGKVTFVAAVSDDLVANGLKAGDWIKETAKVTGGGGGGRPQMAQGSGKDASKLSEALEKARAFAKGAVK